MVPAQYKLVYSYNIPVTVLVSIYYMDGTVSVSHGGVEYGQGINTRVRKLGLGSKWIGLNFKMVWHLNKN